MFFTGSLYANFRATALTAKMDRNITAQYAALYITGNANDTPTVTSAPTAQRSAKKRLRSNPCENSASATSSWSANSGRYQNMNCDVISVNYGTDNFSDYRAAETPFEPNVTKLLLLTLPPDEELAVRLLDCGREAVFRFSRTCRLRYSGGQRRRRQLCGGHPPRSFHRKGGAGLHRRDQ